MNKSKKSFMWLFVLLALTALTVLIITSVSDGFTIEGFMHCLEGISPVWFALAALCSFGFIYFEGAALRCICHRLGHDFNRRRATVYAATDIYFSDITPTAAGGQPAAMYVMVKDGVSGAMSAIALLLNLAMYTLAILILSTVAFILNFDMFLGFDFAAKLFIIVGAIVQLIFIFTFFMCIFNLKLVRKVASFILRILCKLHIFKDYEARLQKLEVSLEQYAQCGELIRRDYGFMFRVLLINLLQRMSLIAVAMCIFIGVGGEPSMVDHAFSAQTFAVLGSNSVPLPGAVGVVDYIFIHGFRDLVPDPVSVELISRGLSFYASFLFCGVVLLWELVSKRFRKKGV